MLAQNFKTATDLGITEDEVLALIQVLGMLERGEISEKHFWMARFWSECGTVGCLCGWANYVSNGAAFPEVNPDHTAATIETALRKRLPLAALALFASDGRTSAGDAKPAHGAIALRNYLTTGEARWAEALAG